jgi:hypothetical protein
MTEEDFEDYAPLDTEESDLAYEISRREVMESNYKMVTAAPEIVQNPTPTVEPEYEGPSVPWDKILRRQQGF